MRPLLYSSLIAASFACTTDKTTVETTPEANAVVPSSGFIGTELRVEVSGDATDWSASTTLSFGSGITVNTVTVASPADLIADVTIADTATPGLTDVTITDTGSDGTLTLGSAFAIQSPAALTYTGDVDQGGSPFFTIVNLNAQTPFDATTDANGNFINEMINAPSGLTFDVTAVTDLQITGRAEFDADASAIG